jgi:hypothetical protein
MVDTHCRPSGTLVPGEVGVSSVGSYNIETYDPGVGERRGIIVFIHGLSIGPIANFPLLMTNGGSPPFASRFGDFVTAVNADNWIVESVSVSEDFYYIGSQAIYNDMATDSAFGSRFLEHGLLNWWDHVSVYNNETYGTGRPVIVMGFSMGAGKAMQIAANYVGRTPQPNLVGYIAHCPVTLMETINPNFTGLPQSFYPINCSGYDLGPIILNNVAVPGIVGYGTNDDAVGWSATTYTGSPVNVASLPPTLSIAATSKIVSNAGNNANLQVTTSTGTAIIAFTGLGSGTLTGCTLLAGSGTMATGAAVTQSMTDQIIANADAAGAPLTRNATADNHEFTGTPQGTGNDAATYAAWIASTIDSTCPVSF